jgi:hypothetical protein
MRRRLHALLFGCALATSWSLVVMARQAQPPAAGAPTPPPSPRPVGSMSELMIRLIYPTSDAVFYITTRTPQTQQEWEELQNKTLTLAESANLLMMPGRARDQDRWLVDAKRMYDAGAAAYRAARAKDVAALEAVNEDLYQSCVECHRHYRPNYGRGAPQR